MLPLKKLSKDIECVQKRLKLLFAALSYTEVLSKCGLELLDDHRDMITQSLFRQIKDPKHPIHQLSLEKRWRYECQKSTKSKSIEEITMYWLRWHCHVKDIAGAPWWGVGSGCSPPHWGRSPVRGLCNWAMGAVGCAPSAEKNHFWSSKSLVLVHFDYYFCKFVYDRLVALGRSFWLNCLGKQREPARS